VVCGSGRSGGGAGLAQGVEKKMLPGPTLSQGLITSGGGASPGDGEQGEVRPTGRGPGWQVLGQADVHFPAGQVVGHGCEGQPGSVGGELSSRHTGQTCAFLEVANDGLPISVATVVRLQLQSRALPVRDEGLLAELGGKRELAPRGGHPGAKREDRGCPATGEAADASLEAEVPEYAIDQRVLAHLGKGALGDAGLQAGKLRTRCRWHLGKAASPATSG
jgi:hypothetical protein